MAKARPKGPPEPFNGRLRCLREEMARRDLPALLITGRPDHLAGDPQRLPAGGVVDQLDVAGVHIDRRHDARGRGPGHMGGEALPIAASGCPHRQQDRRHPADHTAGPDEGERIG